MVTQEQKTAIRKIEALRKAVRTATMSEIIDYSKEVMKLAMNTDANNELHQDTLMKSKIMKHVLYLLYNEIELIKKDKKDVEYARLQIGGTFFMLALNFVPDGVKELNEIINEIE